MSIVGRRKSLQSGPFEVDHIVPQVSGGGDEPENSALCCKSCNIGRAVTFPVKIRKAARRLCYWTLAKIHGTSILISDAGRFQHCWVRTPIGRATIDELRMNTWIIQIEARKYWVEADLYP